MSESVKGIVETLSAIDVSEYVKEKNGNKYLPWARCWSIVKSYYPQSDYFDEVQEIAKEDTYVPRPWFSDGNTAWVRTTVVIKSDTEEIRHTETYPILDLRNKAMPADSITSADFNKSEKRGLTKAVAVATGLGLHLFYGEDYNEDVAKAMELLDKVDSLAKKKAALSDKAKKQVADLCKEAEKKAFPDIPDDEISGNYKNIEDVDILSSLERKLMAVRK